MALSAPASTRLTPRRGFDLSARLFAGPLGLVAFLAVSAVLARRRAGDDASTLPMSALARGDLGWVQRLDFVLLAGCVAVFGAAAGRAMGGRTGRAVLAVLAGVAVALVGLATFRMDAVTVSEAGRLEIVRRTLVGDVHMAVSGVLAVLVAAYCGLSARYFSRVARTRAGLSVLCGLGVVGLSTAFVVTQSTGGPGGLLEGLALLFVVPQSAMVAEWFAFPSRRAGKPPPWTSPIASS